MKIIYLHIGGFYIGIKLYKTESPYFLEHDFKKRLNDLYLGFLVKKPNYTVSTWIAVRHAKDFDIITQSSEQKVFINIYKKIDDNNYLTYYHISNLYLEILLREVLQDLLVKNHGILLHASAISMKGGAYIFLGKSGAGKSTIAKMFFEHGCELIGDDMVILRKEKKQYVIYQIPFFDKNYNKKRTLPTVLKGIFKLKKSQHNTIALINDSEKVLQVMLEQLFTNKDHMKIQMNYILSLLMDFHEIYMLNFSVQNSVEMIDLFSKLHNEN